MQYDIIVIGGGPGGYVAAIKAAQQGKHVCLVEDKWIGGTCLNEGCIPTKALIYSAEVLDHAKHAAEFAVEGIDPQKVSVSMPDMQERKRQVVKRLQSGVALRLKRCGVDVKNGKASFLDTNTVAVNGESITAAAFIIATGSVVSVPKSISRSEDAKVITSRELLEMEKVPVSLVVIGGGVVGIEFAYLLNKIGCQVTVIEAMDEILPNMDIEIARAVRQRLAKDGVTFFTGAMVSDITGQKVTFTVNEKKETVSGEEILMAIGRAPYTGGLGLERIGLKQERGAIVTDAHLRTNLPNIYAIGDVNGRSMLAHTASYEGEVAVANICGRDDQVDYDHIPACVYTTPEVACVGLTEAKARELGRSIKVGRFPMAANGRSLVEGDTDGFVKVILDDKTGEILGVHIFSLHATEIIGGVSALMAAEATVAEVLASIFPHPSVSESLKEAFMLAEEGKAIHA